MTQRIQDTSTKVQPVLQSHGSLSIGTLFSGIWDVCINKLNMEVGCSAGKLQIAGGRP